MDDWKKLGAVALMFVIIAVMLSVGTNVMQSVKEDGSFSSTTTTPNETALITAGGTIYLAFQDLVADSLRVYNVTNGSDTGAAVTLVGAGNYTFQALPGYIVVDATPSYGDNSRWRFDYDRYVRTDSYVNAANATKSIEKMAKYMPILGLVVAASLILGTVLVFLRRR